MTFLRQALGDFLNWEGGAARPHPGTLCFDAEIVLGADPIHSAGHSGRFDDPGGYHRRCALWTWLTALDRALVLSKAGSRRFAELTA